MTTKRIPLKNVLTVAAAIGLSMTAVEAKAPTTQELHKALIAARDEAAWPASNFLDAARRLKTPEAALAFVRDGIQHADYPGNQQGPMGVFASRVANQRERAGLLSVLLVFQGYDAQLVSAPVPGGYEMHTPAGIKRDRPHLAHLKKILAPVASRLSPMTAETIAAEHGHQAKALLKEVEVASAFLQKQLAAQNWEAKPQARPKKSNEPLVWVRARKGNGPWRIFDPSTDGAKLPADAPRVKFEPVKATMDVVYQTAPGKSVSLLSWKGTGPSLAAEDIQIFWMPHDKKIKSDKDLTIPLKVRIAQWKPILQIGKKRTTGKAFTPPANVAAGQQPTVRFRMTITDNGQTKTFDRVIQDFSQGFDQHAFFSSHQIGYRVTGVPAEALEIRMLDELADVVAMRNFAKGGAQPKSFSYQRGFSTRSANIVNKMISTALELDPEGKNLTWQGPAIFIESARLEKRGDDIFRFTMLDMLNQAYAPAPDASTELKMKWGLAVCAAEAQLVGGKSVNHRMMQDGNALQLVKSSKGSALVDEALASNALVFANPAHEKSAWIVKTDGNLLGIVSHTTLLQAKGGDGPATRAERGAVGFTSAVAGLGAMGGRLSPYGALMGGIAGHLNEVRKAFGGATAAINNLTRMMERGSADSMPPLEYDFRNMGQNFVRGITEGYVRGYTSSLSTYGINRATAAGPIRSGLTGFGISAASQRNALQPNEVRAALSVR